MSQDKGIYTTGFGALIAEEPVFVSKSVPGFESLLRTHIGGLLCRFAMQLWVAGYASVGLKYLLTACPGMAILRIYTRRWLHAYEDSKMG